MLHWCNWASQPDIGLACGLWTTPEWWQPLVLAPGVFMGDEGLSFYTFDGDPVAIDCLKCLEAVAYHILDRVQHGIEAL